MSKKQKFQVLSPDGFTIDFCRPDYPSKFSAQKALQKWMQRYKYQGFYSSPTFGRIPFDEIPEYCEIITI